jgi:ABC-type oligopeptide transport system ATPase subunit
MSQGALELKKVSKIFNNSDGSQTHAVQCIDMTFEKGTCIAIVGGSGSGKSTVARLISHLIQVTSGSIIFNGKDVSKVDKRTLKSYYRKVQMVFQNPLDTFSPRMKIGRYMVEPYLNFRIMNKKDALVEVGELLKRVGLDASYLNRYPNELSGGQLQRVVLARTMALEPEVIIFDEATSALDVTIQNRVLELIRNLSAEKSFTSIFITHDLALAEKMADKIYVMCEGVVVETLESGHLRDEAKHPYTLDLLDAVF